MFGLGTTVAGIAWLTSKVVSEQTKGKIHASGGKPCKSKPLAINLHRHERNRQNRSSHPARNACWFSVFCFQFSAK